MNKKNYIFVKCKKGVLKKILLNDITHIVADRDYCKIFTPSKMFYTNATMKTLFEILPNDSFLQCSRSIIVNVDKIETINNRSIFINSDFSTTITNTYKKAFFSGLNCLTTGYEARKNS